LGPQKVATVDYKLASTYIEEILNTLASKTVEFTAKYLGVFDLWCGADFGFWVLARWYICPPVLVEAIDNVAVEDDAKRQNQPTNHVHNYGTN
jgi:hypothetical protein